MRLIIKNSSISFLTWLMKIPIINWLIFLQLRRLKLLFSLLKVIKPLDPIDFPCYFFNLYSIVTNDMGVFVEEFFGSKRILKELNLFFIYLIHNSPNVVSFENFKPISLWNFLYNFFPKVLALILLDILPKITSSQQTDFVSGHKILYFIVIIH